MVLLLAVLVEHDDFDLVLALWPAGGRGGEGVCGRAAARQVERLLKPRNGAAVLAFDRVDDEAARDLDRARRVRDGGDRVDRVARGEAARLGGDRLVLAELEVAQVGRRGAEVTGQPREYQEPQPEGEVKSFVAHKNSSAFRTELGRTLTASGVAPG